MLDQNALELARQVGRNVFPAFGEIGEQVFEELELAFASKLPGSTKFSNSGESRSVQHLLLYWQTGYFKNTLINVFEKCLPEGTSPTRQTGLTAETLFGSINTRGDALVPPVFHKKDFCIISELSALLESGESLSNKAHTFNEALEHQLVGRSLIKFASATADVKSEYAPPEGKDGLILDGITLHYTSNTLFIVATHPLDIKTFSTLNSFGFLSRFHVLQYDITEDIMRNVRTGTNVQEGTNLGLLEELAAELKNENQKLWDTRPQAVALPDYKAILLPVFEQSERYIAKVVDKFDDEKGKDKILKELSHPRIRGNLTREIAAYRLLNKSSTAEDTILWTIQRLPHFYSFALQPIIDDNYVRAKEKRTAVEDCANAIRTSLRGQVQRQKIEEAMENQGFKRDTIARALKAFKKTDRGIYEIE